MFGVADNSHVICVLHAKQRIIERLILLLTGGTREGVSKIIERIRGLPGLNRFNITPKPNIVDHTLMQYRVDMLTGDQCDVILSHYLSIVDNDASEVVRRIWYNTSVIVFEYLEATTDELKVRSLTDLRKTLDQWGKDLTAIYGQKAFSYYVHIVFAHLPQLLTDFGSLLLFSGQGFEHSHKLHRLAWKRITSGGGAVSTKKIKTNPIEQLLVWQCRRILMTLKLSDRNWTPIVKRKRKCVDPITEREAKRLRYDYQRDVPSSDTVTPPDTADTDDEVSDDSDDEQHRTDNSQHFRINDEVNLFMMVQQQQQIVGKGTIISDGNRVSFQGRFYPGDQYVEVMLNTVIVKR